MTIEHVIKAADVRIGPTRVVGSAPPILRQAEAVASAAWDRTNPAQQFFENNVRILSIMPIFSPQPKLNATEAISEAESILKQAARPQIGALEVPIVEPIIAPLPEPEVDVFLGPVTRTDPATETGVSPRTAHPIHAPVTKELEEVVERKEALVEDQRKDQTEVKTSKESSLVKVKIVEDVQASKIRRGEIRAAIKKLGNIGRIGRLVARLLTLKFWQAKSQLVGVGKDYTIPLTIRSLELDTAEYKNAEEAESVLVGYVEEHIPVKKGKGGRGATIGEVRKVIHGGDKEILPKVSVPAEIVVKRIVEKRVAVENGVELVLEDKVDTHSEPNIADLGLSAIFNKGLTDLNGLS